MINKELIEFVAQFKHDPVGFVKAMYPWGEGELEGKSPQQWQLKLLAETANQLADNPRRVHRFAIGSGHGIGKSAINAWLVQWALYTMADTKVVVTANTETQLRTKTWAEFAKWQRLNIASGMFTFTATALYSADVEHEKTWRADAIPWNAANTAAFAGLHNQGKRLMLIFDEASEIDNTIWDVAEGALTDKDTEILWYAFGNRTRNTGVFNDCFVANRRLWNAREIDSRTVDITNKEQLNEWIDRYGLDSDFVKVRILGQAPSSSEFQFIPRKIVEQAKERVLDLHDYEFAPVIIGVDPAWSGKDEATIYMRQGLYSKLLYTELKSDDNYTFAEKIALFEDKYGAAAVNIDFGFGMGIYSAGKHMGRKWNLIHFSKDSSDPQYFNKRAQMWGDLKNWLYDGGALDQEDSEIYEELLLPEIVNSNDGKIKLQRKQDMPRSPNRADGLALTFAVKINAKAFDRRIQRGVGQANGASARDYNPLNRLGGSSSRNGIIRR